MVEGIPFVKLSGAGNDFIAVAEPDVRGHDPHRLAARLCTRALSVGADGLIVVGPAEGDAVRIRFYNPDGSLAEMCGNGSRCAARYAVEQGLVTGDRFRLLTDSGDLPVVARGDGRFEVVMPAPAEVAFDYFAVDEAGACTDVHALWVGVPHAVLAIPEVEQMGDARLIALGRRLRHDPRFPAGTNVNAARIVPGEPIRLRTYERGVESLTKACGTGATATAVVAHARFDRPWPIDLVVDGGRLTIDQRDGQQWLIGDARLVYHGVLGPDALDW